MPHPRAPSTFATPSRPSQVPGLSDAYGTPLADPYRDYVDVGFGDLAWNGAYDVVTIFKELACFRITVKWLSSTICLCRHRNRAHVYCYFIDIMLPAHVHYIIP